MPARDFACPRCGAQIQTSQDPESGLSMNCPMCGASFRVPEGAFTEAPPPRRDEGDDFDRPYSPQDGIGLEGLSSDYSIRIGDWFRYAQAHWRSVLGPMIGYFFVYLLIVFGLIITCVGILALPFLVPPLAAGFTIVGLAQLKGERWTFRDFFGGFRQFGSLLGGVWLVAVVAGLWPVPGQVLQQLGQQKYYQARLQEELKANPNDPFGASMRAQQEPLHMEDPLVLSGLVLRLIGSLVGIYLQVRCMFVLPLIIDRKCGAVESVRGSFRLSRGHFWGLFGTTLLLGLINLAGVLACGIGVLFAFPFTQLVLLAGYLLIAGSRPPVETPQSEPAY
jgi:hypothetical protein